MKCDLTLQNTIVLASANTKNKVYTYNMMASQPVNGLHTMKSTFYIKKNDSIHTPSYHEKQ